MTYNIKWPQGDTDITFRRIQDSLTDIDARIVASGSGTVTSVSIVTANGVSGSVATATTTPAITLTLGAITPSSVVSAGSVTGSNLSGTNTGDQNLFSTIAVSGQSNVVADTTSDTLTLVAGSGVTITTNATTDEITIAASGGSGDVVGPGSATDNALVRFDGATGKLIQNSNATLSDLGALAVTGAITGSNLSGTNTGDQTSIVGITGTKAQFDTACTDGNFLYVGDVTQYTDEMAQDAIGAMVNTSLTYTDLTPSLALTSRNINGVAYDGTADITVTAAAGTLTGATLAAGVTASSLTSVGTLTNLTVTNTITGSISGNAGSATTATNITVANEATDATCFITFVTAATGDLGQKSNANMTFNSSTGVATFASTVLTTTDINGGTVDGTVIGGASAAAITGTAITGNSFVPNSATIPTNGLYLPAANTLGWAVNSAAELQLTGTALSPAADGGSSLGTTALGWQNLFGNTGFVFNIENGDWVATHTAGILTVGTGDLRVTTAGTNTASAVTVGGTQTLTNKTLTAPKIASGGFIADANGNELIIFTTTASAVNEITFANGATGVNPKFTASGEANVGLDFQAKGTGVYRFLATASGPTDQRWFEDTDNGTNYISVIAPAAIAADAVLTLQATTGTIYSSGGTDVALADGGTGASLVDPNADRIMFWDDSAGVVTWLTAGSGLTITDTTITASGSSISAATQAEQEAASSTTVYTSPGTQKFHPAAAKVWGVFNGTGVVSLLANYNVSSITDNGVGDYTINFTTAFSSANYGGGSFCRDTNIVIMSSITDPAAGSYRITTRGSSTEAVNDAERVHFCLFGDQ